MEPMPPPTMPPPCTKGPSFPAISPAAMEKTTPISFAISVLTCTATRAVVEGTVLFESHKRSPLSPCVCLNSLNEGQDY